MSNYRPSPQLLPNIRKCKLNVPFLSTPSNPYPPRTPMKHSPSIHQLYTLNVQLKVVSLLSWGRLGGGRKLTQFGWTNMLELSLALSWLFYCVVIIGTLITTVTMEENAKLKIKLDTRKISADNKGWKILLICLPQIG